MSRTPILDHDAGEAPVFRPDALLEGARRQKGLPETRVPAGCLLDMDGELVARLVASGRAVEDPAWPCFHTRLHRWKVDGGEIGVVGGTVGAPFAVLVAEELFAAGCEALVSVSSAGVVAADVRPPFFVLVERALRDEGTSYHYLPADRWAEADPALTGAVARALAALPARLLRGSSWTTDAPFRESGALVAARRAEGILAVEMEAAALLAFGRAARRPVACLAHVTNEMATRPEDFEKGGHGGQEEALALCARAVGAALAHARAAAAPPARPAGEHWQEVYLRKDDRELSWFQEQPALSVDLVSRTGAGRAARIVDVGGGTSRLVDALLDAGWTRLTVLDVAPAALERARARLGERGSGVAWVACDVTAWEPDGPYDVWHDRAVFHFLVRPEDRAAYRAVLLRALRSGGHAVVGTFAPDGPERCSGLPVVRWEPEALAAELGPELRLVETARDEHVTPSGKVQRFQFSRFVRR